MEATLASNEDIGVGRVTYTYPMVKETDMSEGMKADVRFDIEIQLRIFLFSL